jgi:outer membrane protein, heavy metal efflux system
VRDKEAKIMMNWCVRCLVLLIPWVAIAQQSPPAITVEQAVQTALEKNLGLLAEKYNLDVAETRILTARLRPNPVLTLSGMLPDSGIYNNTISPRDGAIKADFLLERGGKREKRIDLAQRAKSVVQLQLMNTVRTIILDVENACVDLMAAKASLALAQENLHNFQSLVEINQVRVQAGDLAKVDLIRSQIAALQFKNAVIQSESKLKQAGSRLQSLMGYKVYQPSLDLAGEFPRDSLMMPLGELQSLALEKRPDLMASRRDLERSQADLELQIAQGKVDFTLTPEYHRQHANMGENGTISGNLLALSVSTPLPFSNRNQGEIERARKEHLQLGARIQAQENDIRAEVQAAFLQQQSASRQLESMEKEMLSQARQVREITDYSYRQGEASLIELLDAQRAFNETMQSFNEARADYARSLYLLEAVTGNSLK